MPKMKNMSILANRDWERYYQSALKFYGEPKRAAQTAWFIFKKKYKKYSDGIWKLKPKFRKKENPMKYSNFGLEMPEDAQALTPLMEPLQREIIIKPDYLNTTIKNDVVESTEVTQLTEEAVSKGVVQANRIAQFITGKKIDPNLLKNLFALYGVMAFGGKLKGNYKTIGLGLMAWYAYKYRDEFLKK